MGTRRDPDQVLTAPTSDTGTLAPIKRYRPSARDGDAADGGASANMWANCSIKVDLSFDLQPARRATERQVPSVTSL